MSDPDRGQSDQESRRRRTARTHRPKLAGTKPSAPIEPAELPLSPDQVNENTEPAETKQPRRAAASDDREIDPELGLDGTSTAAPDETSFPSSEETARRQPVVRPPRKNGPRVQAELVGLQPVQGKHPGDRYVRVIRKKSSDFERAGPGLLVAREESLASRGPIGRTLGKAKRLIIGAPLTTAAAAHERLTKFKALAVLSSDALSSVAYASEAILGILILAGASNLWLSVPIGIAIAVLMVIVGFSYRQTIKAYPHGGGSYIVAKDNLGELPALTAGGALLIDYILTVAVSVSSGVAALVSAVPELHEHRVLLGVLFIAIVTIVNLRGIRESGSIFAVPTYLFLIGILFMIAVGFVRNASEGFAVHHPPSEGIHAVEGLGIFLILRAFSSGCSAMTGVEAISDGVPAFQPPEWKNARTTLTWMIGILVVTFSGINLLAHQYGALPIDPTNPHYQTVVSQIARSVLWGTSPVYYYVQFTTLAILILAANTAFSDFPRLSYFMARDRYMPRQFTFRGDRLAYTTGIVTLGILSGTLLAIFGGETDRLIPLYAVGVFTSFTLSQSGMVRRWWYNREEGWKHSLPINLAGAVTTGIVAIVIAASKFVSGAWIVVCLIPLLILVFRAINRHYMRASQEMAGFTLPDPSTIKHTVIVPIAAVNRVACRTLAYARSISDNVTAVFITDDEQEIEAMRKAWNELGTDIPLIIIESPYRSLVGPLLHYIDEIDKQRPDDTITVVLPEYIARHWWEHVLHNQTALRIKAALLFRPGIIVTSVPYHLGRGRGALKRKLG